jgi:hypothetical protein
VRSYLEKSPLQIIRAGGVAQGVGPEFKPQSAKKKKKKAPQKIKNSNNKKNLLDWGHAHMVEHLPSKSQFLEFKL